MNKKDMQCAQLKLKRERCKTEQKNDKLGLILARATRDKKTRENAW